MNRTTSALVLAVLLLAAVLGIGWLLRSDLPTDSVVTPRPATAEPDAHATAEPLVGVRTEERTALIASEPTTAEPVVQPIAATTTVAPSTEIASRRVLLALRTPAGDPFLKASGIPHFRPSAIATSAPPHPTEQWSGRGFNCGGKTGVGWDAEPRSTCAERARAGYPARTRT